MELRVKVGIVGAELIEFIYIAAASPLCLAKSSYQCSQHNAPFTV